MRSSRPNSFAGNLATVCLKAVFEIKRRANGTAKLIDGWLISLARQGACSMTFLSTCKKRCILFVLLVFQVGCSEVFIDKPIGEKWTRRETAKLLGRWIMEDGNGEIHEVQRGKSGAIVFGSMRWEIGSQKFEVTQGELSLTHVGDLDFVFIDLRDAAKAASEEEPEKDGGIEGLIPCRIEIKDASTVEMTCFKVELLAKAIEEAKLTGKVTKSEDEAGLGEDRFRVVLAADDEKVVEFFKSPEVKRCLDDRAILKWKRVNTTAPAK